MTRYVYKLTVEDLQNVAANEFGIVLSKEDIKSIENTLADKIPWFELITDCINDLAVDKK